MRDRFESFARAHGAGADIVDRWWREIESRYSEAHRHYHTLTHIRELLDLLPDAAEDVRGAIWFHDVIYDRGSDNEERSAELAREALRELQFPDDVIERVAQLILATKTHAGDADFLDADLAILGTDRDRYRAYADAIRREYEWVPEAMYREGRAKILRSFLERPHIYATPSMRERFEQQARANIEWELYRLVSDPVIRQ